MNDDAGFSNDLYDFPDIQALALMRCKLPRPKLSEHAASDIERLFDFAIVEAIVLAW